MKVLSKMETMFVSGGKRKRDVVVGDSTGTSKVTLWEEHVDAMDVETRYRLEKFVVREYASQKYLSMSRSGSVIVVIDDIGDVETVTYGTSAVTICNPEIIGVPQLDIYKACLRCKARVEPLTPPLGRCSKAGCLMMQRYDRCVNQLSTKLVR